MSNQAAQLFRCLASYHLQRLLHTLYIEYNDDYRLKLKDFEFLIQKYGEQHSPNLVIKYTEELTLIKPVVCSAFNETGYAGQTGLNECLEGTDEISRGFYGLRL
jgi:type II secretory ATPase GspE/PulE/Tfp pilus assembly ATPase PilB-like protein